MEAIIMQERLRVWLQPYQVAAGGWLKLLLLLVVVVGVLLVLLVTMQM